MNIEKVKNGYVVEVSCKEEYMSGKIEIEKFICKDLKELLQFINAHYREDRGYEIVADSDQDFK